MVDIELGIKMPEEVYKSIKNGKNYISYQEYVEGAIKNGTPLPKGHGRLIDAEAFLRENKDYTGWVLCSDAWGGENAYKDTLESLVYEAPTIIEADRSEEDG